jgi:hypothetical protein
MDALALRSIGLEPRDIRRKAALINVHELFAPPAVAFS